MLLTDAREFPAKGPRQACSSAESIRPLIDVFWDFIERHDSPHYGGHKVPPVMPIIGLIILLSALRREAPMRRGFKPRSLLRDGAPYVWSWHLADIDAGAEHVRSGG
jgi:hypothetical protein